MPNSGFGDMLELVIGTSHQRFRWQVVPAGSLARPVGARYEDAPKLSRCQRTGDAMTNFNPKLHMQVVDDEIIITLPGSSYTVTFYKPPDLPQLLAKGFPNSDDRGAPVTHAEFLASSWRLANDKARELGWIV